MRSVAVCSMLALLAIFLVSCNGGGDSSPNPPIFPAPELTNLIPAANDSSVSRGANVNAIFDLDMNAASSTTFVVQGFLTGKLAGIFNAGGTTTLRFTPNNFFKIGEEIEVTLTTGLTSTDGEPLEVPFVYRFRVEVTGGSEIFDEFPILLSPVPVGNSPRSVSVGDWDGDGDLDLAATTAGDIVRIFFNGGSADFSEDPLKSPLIGFVGPRSIIAGDFDNDGVLDLAVGNSGAANVTILINDGTGTFPQPLPPPVPVGNNPQTLIAGDLDGDGDLDLAVTTSGDRVRLLFNDGSAIFSEDPLKSPIAGVVSPISMVAGDWDADGDLDLAVGNSGATNISILINDGTGGFTQLLPPDSPVPVGSTPQTVIVGDLDGDGDLDLAVTTSGDRVRLLFNDGSAIFSEDPLKSPIDGLVSPTAMVVGDWDGDGDLDLAVANSGATNVSILINDGTGDFTQPLPPDSPVEVGNTPQSFPQSMAAGDLDGDGDLDLAVGRTDTNVTLLENTP